LTFPGLEACLSNVEAPFDAEALFRASASPALQYRITRSIVRFYAEANHIAAELASAPFNREIRPWIRRARIHEELQGLQAQFPEVTAEILQTSGSTVSVAIEVGDVQILVARAISPNMMIPQSSYRREIATRSLQGNLFGQTPPSAGAKLYAVVLHGGDRGGPAPSFVVIRFPTADHANYLDAKIDLLAEYMSAASEGADVEQVVATHALTLKPGLKNESGTA
jgi:hypothetical protein